MDAKEQLVKFINEIPEVVKAGNEYWGESKATGKFTHTLRCSEHGVMFTTAWNSGDEAKWEGQKEEIKFCHICGKALDLEDTEDMQKHVGEGNINLLMWDPEFRAKSLAELTGQEYVAPVKEETTEASSSIGKDA